MLSALAFFALQTSYHVETVAKDLRVVWSLAFLPGDRTLFVERPGRIRLIAKGKLQDEPVLTIPDVDATGKLGALGMTLHPGFGRNHLLYLAYAYKNPVGPRVRIVRYREKEGALVEPKTILEEIPAWTNHCGCRLRFGPDGKLYATTGDADKPDLAQRLDSLAGKILRLNDDGTIPKDNPFAGQEGKRGEVWSYGHRNSQGIDFQPGTGALYETEHGPTGGDELNRIEKGKNYGWPIAHHDQTAPGTVAPLTFYGVPSPAPGSTTFYRGKAFPQWHNDLLVGCLRGECILHFKVEGGRIVSQERLLEHQYGRIREVVEAPDGSVWFTTSMFDPPEANGKEGYDQILRIVPDRDPSTRRALVFPVRAAAAVTSAG